MTSYIIIYDDRSSAFDYHPENVWFSGTWNASNVGQNGTLHTANDLTAIVTFTFPVPAIGFSYFGIKRSLGGLYGICIDCIPGAPNFIPVDAFNATDDGQNPPVALYNQTFSTLGIHQIIIQNMADPRGKPANNSQITVDRFELTVPTTTSVVTTALAESNRPISSIATTTSSISSVISGNSSTISGIPTKTTTSIQASNSSTVLLPSSSSPVGEILGSALGAFALLIGVTIFLCRRRFRCVRTREEKESRMRTVPFDDPPISHFRKFRDDSEVSISPSTSSKAIARAAYGRYFPPGNEEVIIAPWNKRQWIMPSEMPMTTSTQTPVHAPLSTSVTTSRSATAGVMLSAIAVATGSPRRESDAGPLLVPLEEEEETLPPAYGKVFGGQV